MYSIFCLFLIGKAYEKQGTNYAYYRVSTMAIAVFRPCKVDISKHFCYNIKLLTFVDVKRREIKAICAPAHGFSMH